MNCTIYKCAFLALISFFIYSCSQDSITDNTISKNEISDINLNYSIIEIDIINLVNNYRIENNFNPLNILNIVSLEAINHTKYMIEIGELSHDNFSKRYAFLSKNVNVKSMSENLAYGHSTAQGVFDSWIESNVHKNIIETTKATDVGISIMKDEDGKNYFTMIFIER